MQFLSDSQGGQCALAVAAVMVVTVVCKGAGQILNYATLRKLPRDWL
jgi:hypothetical protein